MLDELIQKAARLMAEQAAAYRQLDTLCGQLCVSLVRGEPERVEHLSRAGEGELLRMRARLGQIMTSLATFGEERGRTGEPRIGEEARRSFETASHELTRSATEFSRTQQRTAALANGGATFASACIEQCGVAPTTYRAPYAARATGAEVRAWA